MTDPDVIKPGWCSVCHRMDGFGHSPTCSAGRTAPAGERERGASPDTAKIRDAWDSLQFVLDPRVERWLHRQIPALLAELDSLRSQVATAREERDAARAELAELKAVPLALHPETDQLAWDQEG